MRTSPITHCSKCGCEADDWSLGCATCMSRHYKRVLRSGDPVLISRHYAIGREHVALGLEFQTREGRRVENGRYLPRGERGRWTRSMA